MTPDQSPIRRKQYNDRDLAARYLLLISQMLIGGDESAEGVFLGNLQQFAVLQPVPAAFKTVSISCGVRN